MIQKSELLTLEDNRISLVSARRTTIQEGYVIATERGMPVNAIEQPWIFEGGERARAGRTTPRLVSTLANIMKWLSRVGSGRIDSGCLEARQNIHNNFRMNGIGR